MNSQAEAFKWLAEHLGIPDNPNQVSFTSSEMIDAYESGWQRARELAKTAPACRTCGGRGTLTVPDSDGESASEQACPDCGPEPECLASHCPPSMFVDCEYPKCAPDSARDAIDAQTLHDSPGADL